MLDNEKVEDIAMTIIANAGGAKSSALEAIKRAKGNDFEGAEEAMDQSRQYSLDAHNAHSTLLTLDARGELPKPNVLMTHAQDHFMIASLAQDMAVEIIDLYKRMKEQEVGK